jgi:3-phenylpropionate/cinnamic acid dioxygenase small subunit
MSGSDGGARERWEIADLLHGYADAVDARDWVGVAALFIPGAEADYGDLGGLQQGTAAIIGHCAGALERFAATQHLIGNVRISFATEGCSATTTCSFLAVHLRHGGADPFVVGGRYNDEVILTPDGWRIARRQLRPIWRGVHAMGLGPAARTPA